MKKLAILTSLVVGLSLSAWADKVEGEASCAKCALKEADKCQTVITTAKGDKLYVAQNDIAKGFHKEVCKASAKVTAEGTIAEKDGKKTITLTKIDKK